MKKRLRKKLHKGEFQKMGFYIDFECNSKLSEKELDAYWEKFIEEAIEGNNLCVGGGGDYAQTYFVQKQKGSASLNDIDKLRK